jgi:hypothetical protein
VIPYYIDDAVTLYRGDMLETAIPAIADLFVTDPPYSRATSAGQRIRRA